MGIFGTWGYLGFLIWAVVTASLAPRGRILIVLGTVVAFSVLFCARGLRLIRRGEFWFLIASALLLSPFFIGEKDIALWGLRLSRQGFWTGLWMTVRALTIALAFNGFASTVSVAEVAALFEGAGLKGLGFAVGVAFNMLPTVRETAEDAFNAMRLRGGFRCHRLEALKMLLVAVVAGSLRHGDEIVSAAEARAFSPGGGRGEPVRPTSLDLALIAVLMAVGLAILVW